jgi:arsenate reductase-like glutaredoxin family protein
MKTASVLWASMNESDKSKYVKMAVSDKKRFEGESERIELLKKNPKKRDLKSAYKQTPHEHISTKSENYSNRALDEEELQKKPHKNVNHQSKSWIQSQFGRIF